MAYDYVQSLDNAARERYDGKLQVIGLTECPFRLAGDHWINDPTDWPHVEFGDIYTYLLDTPGKYI